MDEKKEESYLLASRLIMGGMDYTEYNDFDYLKERLPNVIRPVAIYKRIATVSPQIIEEGEE